MVNFLRQYNTAIILFLNICGASLVFMGMALAGPFATSALTSTVNGLIAFAALQIPFFIKGRAFRFFLSYFLLILAFIAMTYIIRWLHPSAGLEGLGVVFIMYLVIFIPFVLISNFIGFFD